jgi:hypothetical protein
MTKSTEKIRVPKKITTENCFAKPHTWHNGETLAHKSRTLFHPTEKELDDQIFNLDATIAGFLLPRMIYFRDKNYGCPPIFETLEEFTKAINMVIKWLYLFANFDSNDIDSDPIATKEYEDGKKMFIAILEHLWL